LLELGLIDEIDLHIRLGDGDPTSAVNVRYRPTTTAKTRDKQ
jgi:hypothetical protein